MYSLTVLLTLNGETVGLVSLQLLSVVGFCKPLLINEY